MRNRTNGALCLSVSLLNLTPQVQIQQPENIISRKSHSCIPSNLKSHKYVSGT